MITPDEFHDVALAMISGSISAFHSNKGLADKAISQLSDDKLHVAPDANTNSIAVIMKHVAGTLISQGRPTIGTPLRFIAVVLQTSISESGGRALPDTATRRKTMATVTSIRMQCGITACIKTQMALAEKTRRGPEMFLP